MAKNLEELVKERYRHPEVRQAILDEIRQKGEEHEGKIISGELTLPSEHDAARHVSGESHWEQADLHARADSKRYHSGPNPREHEKAKAKTRELMGEN